VGLRGDAVAIIEREAAMSQERNFVYPKDVSAYGFDWGKLMLTVGPEVNGATQFSAGVVDLPSGQGHARHNHPGAEEIIFVISGEGEQMVEDPDGNPVTQRVSAGCTVFVPASRFHSTRNTGSGPMQLFVVYSPAGPETTLRDLPDFRLLPPGS
jgi:oxalate decarboxylase/phosphoglucose isomerase-like protein (cupin superfamily)